MRTERKSIVFAFLLFLVSAILGVFVGILGVSITERRAERELARIRIIEPLGEFESDNAKWGINFPREYNSWELTKKTDERTKYGGSSFRDYLASNPRLVVLWAGYPFSKDYNQARGHFHALEDVSKTGRIDEKSPATCITCKSSDVPRLMAKIGVERFYEHKFSEMLPEARNTIGCLDCHDPKTMRLRISRPALIDGFRKMGKDVTKASYQEMRTLVCAQCHVEYYFKDKKYLTFPWDNGLKVEEMEEYYERVQHTDWVHAISGAKMLKMQHPDYEVYMQGIHSFRGVSCADCHMPYKVEGGIKFTDHQVRSPLHNIANSCQVCHRWSEEEVKMRVTSIQDKTQDLLNRAENELVRAHLEIGDAWRKGATDAELEKARHLVRKAQMYWDYVAANNGMGFHAPQECARILAKAIQLAMESRLEAQSVRARKGLLEPVALPDLSSKEKAQAFVQSFIPKS